MQLPSWTLLFLHLASGELFSSLARLRGLQHTQQQLADVLEDAASNLTDTVSVLQQVAKQLRQGLQDTDTKLSNPLLAFLLK